MLQPTWNPFSSFADKFEVRVDKLLRRAARLGIFEAQRQVLALMQENVVILNLYMEARLKGYKYLTTGARKNMYRNAQRTGELFLRFTRGVSIKDQDLQNHLKSLGLSRPNAIGASERINYLAMMMAFLKPAGEHYKYLEGASFGKLLTNIEKGEKMIGDCNQIVTFYTYLYSLRYDINELQIKILPGHVCLHYLGLDIEATAGSFANHAKYEKILPIVELISTNLLDMSDFRDKQLAISPREFLKGAQLANCISSEREIVTRNLQAAYHNVAIQALQQKDFETARFFADKAGVSELRTLVEEQKQYYQLLSKLTGSKEMSWMKNHRGDYQKLLDLAVKMENSALADNLRQILKQLQ